MRPAQLTPENRPSCGSCSGSQAGFNEAGAINAGKLDQSVFRNDRYVAASMRPAQLTPENVNLMMKHFQAAIASMRPAQLTPENPGRRRRGGSRPRCFNEAGAINAGKPAAGSPGAWRRSSGFNEAGAINAGKRDAGRENHYGPEGFNEAGAINAGKPHTIMTSNTGMMKLQ